MSSIRRAWQRARDPVSYGAGIELDRRQAVLLWAAVALPSCTPTDWGAGGAAAFLAADGLLVAVLVRFTLPWLGGRGTLRRWAPALGTATVAVLAFAVVCAYPTLDVHRPHDGSDNDDQLIVAVHEALDGRFPFRARTYDGGIVSALPGELALALPFVLVGGVQLMNPAALALALRALRRRWPDPLVPLLVLWTALLASIDVWRQLLIGTDYVWTGLLLAVLVLASAARPPTPRPATLGLAALLGLAAANRPNTLLVLLPWATHLWRRHGARSVPTIAVGGAVAALAVIPWWAWDADHFSPFQTASRVQRFDAVFSGAGALIVATTITAAVLGAVLASRGDAVRLALGCALTLGAPVVLGLAIGIAGDHLGPRYAQYGYYAMPFALFAVFAPRSADT